ncbi:MAG: hypothetical protein WC414_03165 [Patescibacteria group bacterium]
MSELKNIAWKNLKEDFTNFFEKPMVFPTKIGEIYPLIDQKTGEDFLGIYIGKHQLYKGEKKEKILFVFPNKRDLIIFSSNNFFVSEEEECFLPPTLPAGLSVSKNCIADKKIKKIFSKNSE